MSNLNKFHTELVDILTNQTISSVEWNDSRSSGVPIYSLSNGDKISLRIGVSISDYDLFCSYTHNQQRESYYIDYSDSIGEPLPKINEGVSVHSADMLSGCAATTITKVQIVGNGQEACIRLILSNDSHIVYYTSYGSPECSVTFHKNPNT